MEGMRQIPDNSIDLMLTDPPYNITASEWDKKIDLTTLWSEWKRIVKHDGVFLITSSQPFTSILVMSNISMFKYEWIWNKGRPTSPLSAKYMPMKKHENICVFYKKNGCYNPILTTKRKDDIRDNNRIYRRTNNGCYGDSMQEMRLNENRTIPINMKYPDSILDINRVGTFGFEKTGHPNQKPIALFRYLIQTYSNEGDLIYDGYMGSGTTAIAAMEENRNWIGFEIDEDYYKAASKRIKMYKKRPKPFFTDGQLADKTIKQKGFFDK